MKTKKPHIILCHPQHPGNIGFSARAMKTMGFENLVIVAEKSFDRKAAKITATDAKDIVEKAITFSLFEEIMDKYHFIIAFTARGRRFRNAIGLKSLATRMESIPQSSKVGLLFGRENSGLTNKEIEGCQCVVTIPTSNKFHSLNLSHAVQIVCYELTKSSDSRQGKRGKKRGTPATSREREAIFDKLMIASARINLKEQEADKIAKILRILFEERDLTKREAGAIHRLFDQIIHHRH